MLLPENASCNLKELSNKREATKQQITVKIIITNN